MTHLLRKHVSCCRFPLRKATWAEPWQRAGEPAPCGLSKPRHPLGDPLSLPRVFRTQPGPGLVGRSCSRGWIGLSASSRQGLASQSPLSRLQWDVAKARGGCWLWSLSSLLVLISLNPGAVREEPSLSLRCDTRETVKLEKITSFEYREISAGWLILGKYLF